MTLSINAQNADLNSMNEEFVPTYRWNLSDLEKVKKNGLKVFSCFACGGGSTMGYKLAGFDVIGANDIDPEMAWHYQTNHKPKYYFLEDIRKFRQRTDLPQELYNLDILDGSPPCSSFSDSGSREKAWGKKKVFREGQAEQVLDDLFFDFIELARKLQPKVVIAENVKGMIKGNAKGYVKQIIGLFNVAGYDVQLFLLNASTMGVPQERERVFFICKRKDFQSKKLNISMTAKPVPFKEIRSDGYGGEKLSPSVKKWWEKRKDGDPDLRYAHLRHTGKSSFFNYGLIYNNKTSWTIMANCNLILFDTPRRLNAREITLASSFPEDYKVRNSKTGMYLMGMSVPPLMTYGVARQIYQQWFKGK
jgi:DNA (cytosine-5)-methyltransferase 1